MENQMAKVRFTTVLIGLNGILSVDRETKDLLISNEQTKIHV